MVNLTREQIQKIADTSGWQSVREVCNMALRTHDAEQRVEQAEADHAEAAEECHYHMEKRNEYRDEARRMKAQRDRAIKECDEARQEAANLRQSLQTAVDDLKPTFNLTSEAMIAAAPTPEEVDTLLHYSARLECIEREVRELAEWQDAPTQMQLRAIVDTGRGEGGEGCHS